MLQRQLPLALDLLSQESGLPHNKGGFMFKLIAMAGLLGLVTIGAAQASQRYYGAFGTGSNSESHFTSGYTRNAIIHNGRLDPGVQLITKPFSYEDLALRVRRLLDGPGPNSNKDASS